jgi:hypothetical protein
MRSSAGSSARTFKMRSRKPLSSTMPPCLGVAGEVLDLLGRRRVVDAHRRGPQELGGGVEPVEVGSVAHHQQHLLAGTDTGGRQAGGGLRDLVGVLLQRPGVPSAAVAHRVQCGVVGVGADEFEKVSWHGSVAGGLVDLGDAGQRCQGGHVTIVTRGDAQGNMDPGAGVPR